MKKSTQSPARTLLRVSKVLPTVRLAQVAGGVVAPDDDEQWFTRQGNNNPSNQARG